MTIMAPILNSAGESANSYHRLIDHTKPKTFISRIKHEKSLPMKKRMFPADIMNIVEKSTFKLTPYEKPVTRSRGRRQVPSSTNIPNNANKENKAIATGNKRVSIESVCFSLFFSNYSYCIRFCDFNWKDFNLCYLFIHY